jgi:hypothetical protein
MVVRSGLDTYTGYVYLVEGWGDSMVIRMPPKLAIIGPAFNAFRKAYVEIPETFIPHSYNSGSMRAELLCLAYLDL